MQIAGNDKIEEFLTDFQTTEYTLPLQTRAIISNWYRGRAYIFDNSIVGDGEEDISLFKIIEETIVRYGVKFILLDNLMTALDVEPTDDLYLSQSKFIKKLKRIATKWEVFILVIAHPRKESKGAELNNDSVSGSSDITNAVDIVLTYSRNSDSDSSEYQSVIGVTKNRLTGRTLTGANRLKVMYSAKSKRIAENIAEKTKVYKCFQNNSLDDYVDIGGDLNTVLDNYTFTL